MRSVRRVRGDFLSVAQTSPFTISEYLMLTAPWLVFWTPPDSPKGWEDDHDAPKWICDHFRVKPCCGMRWR